MIRDNVAGAWHERGGVSATWVWWLGLALLCVVPFLSSWRTGPLAGLYLEGGALLFAAALTALTALTQQHAVRLPRASVYWLLLALLLVVQARAMALPYASQSDMTAAIFMGLALLSWSARAWVLRIGQQQAVVILAWALLAGAYLQSLVGVLQFIGETSWLPGLLAGPGQHQIFGQLGQRNHLGHYLMWGVLALCYLWHERKLSGWLALLLMVWLTGVMGLVGSRTIIAYIIAIGLALGFWRWRGGHEANRLIVIVALAIGLVLAAQFLLSPLLGWLGGMDFQSGAERMGASSFEQSGRQFEWRKAWQVFLAQPGFGHGWGSYAYQGFRENSVYAQDFRLYETNVLFTHAHNLILQLLAETGLVGTLLVVTGFVWVAWGFVRRPFSAASMILTLMLLVSLCHSMLEYPLWYVYFLAVFALMLALTPAAEFTPTKPMRFRWSLVLVCLLMMADLMRVGVVYQDLLTAGRSSNDAAVAQQNIDALSQLRAREYWLRYYVDMTLVQKIDAAQAPLPEWGQQAADLAGRYRPYSNTFVRGLYLAQAGDEPGAAQWLRQMARYYPALIPYFADKAQQQPTAAALRQQLQADCQQYTRDTGRQLTCTGAAMH